MLPRPLRNQFSADQLTELSAQIAFENYCAPQLRRRLLGSAVGYFRL